MKNFIYKGQARAKLFLILLMLAASIGLYAQQATLSVQGVLTKSDGTAVDDGNDYTLTFRLWNNESSNAGANKKHEETINNVSIVGGVYSVVLGVNGTPLAAQFNETYWLGVSVGTSTIELLPRPRLTHAPYALGIVGQNNNFPSTGAVIADAINIAGTASAVSMKANGGAPTSGITVNGFSFKNGTGGDADGGLFSIGDNNVGLYANAIKALEASSGGVTIPGTLTSGQTTTGAQTVNGNETVTGNSQTNGKVLTSFANGGGGYSFTDDGAYDSGMFGTADGEFELRSNGTIKMTIRNTANIINGPTQFVSGQVQFTDLVRMSSQVAMSNLPDFNGKNMQWDPGSGLVGADNSSRRFKQEIETLNEDWSLILKARPVTYTRKSNPNRREVGYIAEEMDSIGLTRLVEHDKDGVIDGFDYERMILYVTEVLKIQHADIENLQAEVAALKAANTGLKTENTSLRTDNGGLVQQQSTFNAQLEELSKRMKTLEKRDER